MIRSRQLILLFALILFLAPGMPGTCALNNSEGAPNKGSKLLVVLTSGDREVALKMVFMYTYNAKKNGWWDEVQLLVWGPSSRIIPGDDEMKEALKNMKEVGVQLTACKACANSYGVSEALEKLGITVKYMGKPLTEMLKSEWTTITF